MRKFINILSINLSLFMITTCFQSCTKENELEPRFNEEKTTDSEVLEWDESFHPYDTKGTNQSDQMAVTSSNIYIGATYTKKSVNDLTFDWISKPVEPIFVSYTFPRYYFDEIQRPSVSSMYRSLNKAISSPQFSGKQSLSFEYDMRQFMQYNELKLAFGAKVNVASIFKLDASFNDTNIKSKSGLFARVVQKNFSVIMDYPYDGNIFLNNNDLYDVQTEEPLYINSIIFGRMAILAIESDYSYDELKAAVKASFTAKIVNGELELSAEHKKILQESTMRIFVSGGAGQDVARIVEGYNEFNNFIINGGEFTQDIPGVPIFFTANYVKDNSVFTTNF